MAGIPHDHYEPKPGFQTWLHNRLPVVSLLYDTLMLPTPKNLNWMWIWGIVLTFCLALQIITGIVLVMHYTPHVDMAFASIEHIMRNVNGGYMIRYLHMNGASLFFFAVYLHIFRGLYYGSYKAPREVTWIIGIVITMDRGKDKGLVLPFLNGRMQMIQLAVMQCIVIHHISALKYSRMGRMIRPQLHLHSFALQVFYSL